MLTRPSTQPPRNDGQRRGELGIWMGESGGPGVQILRVTQGSAADEAGLRPGDIILQVNGRGASSPQVAAQMIRTIPIGQSGTITIWRDGDQQQRQVTMRPVREIARELASDASRRVGYSEAEMSANGDLASRTMRLEQQISSLTQELATLRQELAQLRTAGPVQTGFNTEVNQPAPPQEPPGRYSEAPKTPAPPAANPTPPPASAPPEPAKPAAEPAKPAAPPAAPVTPPAPSTDKSSSNDLFGSPPAQPKSEEKPKADDKSKSDDLFK
jgi:hypothetical protein